MNAPVLRLTQARWFRWLATQTPPGRALASRFVAGERLDDAIEAARSLAKNEIRAMLDHLGENVTAPEQASEAVNAYVGALDRIREEGDLDCMVSVKLSQLGLDFSSELCISHMERVMAAASSAGSVVMIDMESSAYVDRTLAIFRDLHRVPEVVGGSARPSAPPGAERVPGPGVHPLRRRMVSLPDKASGGGTCKYVVLPVEPGEEREMNRGRTGDD